MFYAFSKVERLFQNHFQSDSAIIRVFDHIIVAVAKDGMGVFPNICCSEHNQKTAPFLIFEYIRYHEAKGNKKHVL
jgi:hypothetical protein